MAWVSLIAGMEYGMDYGMDDQNQKNLFSRLGSPALPGISYAGYNSALESVAFYLCSAGIARALTTKRKPMLPLV